MKRSGLQLFNTQTILAYMEDVLTVCSQLPVYSQMNSIYSDPSATSFDSPDLDYYKLQFLNHYRFSASSDWSPATAPFAPYRRDGLCSCHRNSKQSESIERKIGPLFGIDMCFFKQCLLKPSLPWIECYPQ